MLKNCANFIISWVDSHIIDYPTAKLLFGIYIISLVLLLFFSPVLTIILLLGFSIYFCYKAKYKNIIKIWGFFIVSWYLLFTAFLIGFDALIVIGNIECGTVSDETRKLYFFIKKRYCGTSSILESFCFNTFFFCLLSSSLGFPIYIPSVLKGILFVLKLILKFISGGRVGGPSVDCSPEDGGKGFSSKSVKICRIVLERPGVF